ncbi:MAG TPA: diguanylate cyclase [Thermotogota bacterium]|nr:diguanylate cyclase [Thermotogota bacterium]HRW93792.1 diguanylate cyclase [Thermotogota bacterium]
MDSFRKKEKILIVDDNKENISILMDLFRDRYKIVPAIHPQRALEIARSDSPPDIILLDILMPGMDGYEVCNVLKNDEDTKKIPVIFVTAVSEVMDAARGFALGAVDYITKPFHPPMVKARVHMHLDLKRKQELLEEFAFIDALTEIPNRRRLDEVLGNELHRATRSNQPLSVIMMDIDYFKEYNDSYGHGKGDEALRMVAGTIQGSLQRAGDFVARYGGEEFLAILPYSNPEQARAVSEQIRKNVQGLHIAHGHSPVSPVVTISVGGVTLVPNLATTPCGVIEQADKAMYQAKQDGKNRVVLIDLTKN